MTNIPASLGRKAVNLARMVKIEHSVFALPFAYIGAFLAAEGWPGLVPFLLLTVAMVAVRSFAMAFNRLVDLPFDRINPRTANRPLVTGQITRGETIVFLVLTAGIFVACCWGMNRLCLILSGPALIWSAFYSVTKRFTWLCHFVLGSVLGLAPLAGWFCVYPKLAMTPLLFFFGVTFWVAGFDLLYACQDEDFDRREGLHSLPARMGVPVALGMSLFCHVNAVVFFGLGIWSGGLSWIAFSVWAVTSFLLMWQHRLISPQDMSRVNMAFFTVNGVVSVVLFAGVLADLLILGPGIL